MERIELQKSFADFDQMSAAFKQLGCTDLMVKLLAPNQDNEKNQVFIGSSGTVMQAFPGELRFGTASESLRKDSSEPGRMKFEEKLDFSWVWTTGVFQAPGTKMIDYFQYPEVRLSGFLSGCAEPPDALRRKRQDLYGRRLLVLGIAGDRVYGTVVTDHDGGIVAQLLHRADASEPSRSLGTFRIVSIAPTGGLLDRAALLAELAAVRAGNPHPSVRLLPDGRLVPFNGAQGAGYTLEALLGVATNGRAAPDKYGFEIKTFRTARVTLMTTEPDFGLRHDDVDGFMARYGRPSQKPGKESIHFTGPFQVGRVTPAVERTGLMLAIDHWDHENEVPTGGGEPVVALIDREAGYVAAGWSISRLSAKWAKKHAGAVYVHADSGGVMLDGGGSPAPLVRNLYSYTPPTYLGEGTSVLHFLRALGAGAIVLDPGDSQANTPEARVHRRTQWRVPGGNLKALGISLSPLYDEFLVDPVQG